MALQLNVYICIYTYIYIYTYTHIHTYRYIRVAAHGAANAANGAMYAALKHILHHTQPQIAQRMQYI